MSPIQQNLWHVGQKNTNNIHLVLDNNYVRSMRANFGLGASETIPEEQMLSHS